MLMLKKLLIAGCSILAAQTADAAVVTVSGAFTATDWRVYFNTPVAPINPLYLSYTATFDTDLDYDSDTSVVTVDATNIPYDFSFSYAANESVFVLATYGSSGGCGHPAGSFCAFVGDFSSGVPYFVEQSPTTGGGWVAGTITGGLPTGGVPEPASWALMIAGFGLMGAALRRRKPAIA